MRQRGCQTRAAACNQSALASERRRLRDWARRAREPPPGLHPECSSWWPCPTRCSSRRVGRPARHRATGWRPCRCRPGSGPQRAPQRAPQRLCAAGVRERAVRMPKQCALGSGYSWRSRPAQSAETARSERGPQPVPPLSVTSQTPVAVLPRGHRNTWGGSVGSRNLAKRWAVGVLARSGRTI